MQALPDTPQICEIQCLTRDALQQIGRQNPAPSISHNSRAPAKHKGHQEGIKATNRVASPGLGIKMKATMLVLRGVTTAILMTHGTSSTPNVTVGL